MREFQSAATLLIKGVDICRILKGSGDDVVEDLILLNKLLWVCDMSMGNGCNVCEIRAWFKSLKRFIILLDMVFKVTVVI